MRALASLIDSVTVQGQVELATLGPLADRVTARHVGLAGAIAPAAGAAATAPPAAASVAGDDGEGLPAGPVGVVGAFLLLAAVGVVATRARAAH